MNKKMLLLCCAVSLVFGATANAKDSPHHNKMKAPERPSFEQMEERLAKKLDLTAEQQEKAKQINLSGREQMDELMQQMRVLREKMDEIRGKNMLEFESILTPKQKIKFEEMKMERREHFRHGKFDKKDKHGHDFDGKHFNKKKCDSDRCPEMKKMKGGWMEKQVPAVPENLAENK